MEKITELYSERKVKDDYIKEAKKAADIVDKGIEKGDIYRFLHSYYVIVDKFRYLEIITDRLNLSLDEVSDNLVEGKLRYFYENNQFVVADYIGLLNSPMEIAMIDSIEELDKLKGILAEQETLAAEQNVKAEDIPLLIENRIQEKLSQQQNNKLKR